MKANDPVSLKERERKDRQADKQLKTDLIDLLKLPAGRRVLWSYLAFCGIHREVFSTNALQMAFNDGRRSVGLKLEADIVSADPAALLSMMQAQIAEEDAENG